MFRAWAGFSLLLLVGCGGRNASIPLASSSSLECAPFARQVSGIDLYGDAASWWDEAAGRYERASEPMEGGVLVFRRSSRLPSGHVSVVVSLVSGSEIRVTQSNWVHHRITRDEPVVDVSARHDWSRVKVWWQPANMLGTTVYPTYGFILPSSPRRRGDLVAGVTEP